MLKAGVLGAGHLGKIHLRLLNQSEKYNLVGFYDADVDNAKKVAEEFEKLELGEFRFVPLLEDKN